jgi:hypothetical protein
MAIPRRQFAYRPVEQWILLLGITNINMDELSILRLGEWNWKTSKCFQVHYKKRYGNSLVIKKRVPLLPAWTIYPTAALCVIFSVKEPIPISHQPVEKVGGYSREPQCLFIG